MKGDRERVRERERERVGGREREREREIIVWRMLAVQNLEVIFSIRGSMARNSEKHLSEQ